MKQTSRNVIVVLALAGSAMAQGAEDENSYSFGREGKHLGVTSEAGASAKAQKDRDQVQMRMHADGRAFSRRARLLDYEANAVAGETALGEAGEFVRLNMGSVTLMRHNLYSWGWFNRDIDGVHTYSIFEASRNIRVLGYNIGLGASVTSTCTLGQKPEAWNSAADAPEGADGERGARISGKMTGSAHGVMSAGVRVLLIRVKAVGEFELMNATLEGYERKELVGAMFTSHKGGLIAQNGEIVGAATVRARGVSALVKVVVQIRGIFRWRTLVSVDILKRTAQTFFEKLLDHDEPIDYAAYWNQFLQ